MDSRPRSSVLGPFFCLMACLVLALAMPAPALAGYGVHFESYRTPEAAERAWGLLAERYPDLLGGVGHVVQRADLGPERGVFHRILAGPFPDQNQAQALADRFVALDVYAMVLPLDPQPVAQDVPPDDAPPDVPPAPRQDHAQSPPPEPPEQPVAVQAKPYRVAGPKRRPSNEELAQANQPTMESQESEMVVTEDGRTWVPAPLPGDPGEAGPSSPVRVYVIQNGVTVRTRLDDSVSTTVDVMPSMSTIEGNPSGSVAAGLTWYMDAFTVRPKIEYTSNGDISPFLGLGVSF